MVRGIRVVRQGRGSHRHSTWGQTGSLEIGHNSARVDGKVIMLSTPALEQTGGTYIPLRFVAETFGARVEWNPVTKAVVVHHPSRGESLTLTTVPADAFSIRTATGVRPQDGYWEGEVLGEFSISFAIVKGGSVVTSPVLSADSQLCDPREFSVVDAKFAPQATVMGI